MKRLFIILSLMLLQFSFALAQKGIITVKFTAENTNGDFCKLYEVNVANVTQGWSQTLVYPDTALVVTSTYGVSEFANEGGLSQNRPNPFYGSTEADFVMVESGNAMLRLIRLDGKIVAERNAFIEAGEYHINVLMDEVRIAILQVVTANHNYAIKLLNLGHGGANSIELNPVLKRSDDFSKAGGVGNIAPGDIMRYTGIVMQGGNMVNSNTVTQEQHNSEMITLLIPSDPQLPAVTTENLSNIGYTTATCGGDVTDDNGSPVTARGVCWSTSQNPTISGNHTSDGSGNGSFTSSITGLYSNTTYYVRAYATNNEGTRYGAQKQFKTVPGGAITGRFSVSGTKKVYFSKGNLRHLVNSSMTYKWSFFETQWSYMGSSVHYQNIDQYGSCGYIDLFSYGGNSSLCYNPTFGYNTILYYSNIIWRTLTKNEWEYILFNRTTSSGKRFAKATVNGVKGLIILPDDWKSSYYSLSKTNNGEASFSSNVITSDNWTSILEVHGAVFLPAAGYRSVYDVKDVGIVGSYWSSTANGSDCAYSLAIFDNWLAVRNDSRQFGQSVRLVTDVE